MCARRSLRAAAAESIWAITALAMGMAAMQILQDGWIGVPLGRALSDGSRIERGEPIVDRARKSDRIDLADINARFAALYESADRGPEATATQPPLLFVGHSTTRMSIVVKSKGVRSRNDRQPVSARRAPVPERSRTLQSQEEFHGCEPVASPYVDPMLARISGRCVTSLTTQAVASLD